jgi:protein-S-isoprenylcysteine O-methyltransferase Ste14
MFVLMRAVTYATLFIGLVLVFVPARLLSWSGLEAPLRVGPIQAAGLVLVALGAILALWCVGVFAVLGRGTPAPMDPPRELVVRGPYRYVRNPMYIGAGLALGGAALYFGSLALLAYLISLATTVSAFVILYEEPKLKKTFGVDYIGYCESVGRWWPKA